MNGEKVREEAGRAREIKATARRAARPGRRQPGEMRFVKRKSRCSVCGLEIPARSVARIERGRLRHCIRPDGRCMIVDGAVRRSANEQARIQKLKRAVMGCGGVPGELSIGAG